MNKISLITLAVCAGLPIMAQTPTSLTISSGDSNVSFYGILDAGVGHVSHTLGFDEYHPVGTNPTVGSKTATTSATGVFNGGISQTRIGVKGSTAICEDLKGIFVLESAINLNSGNISNAAQGMALNTSAASAQTFSADSAIDGQLFSRAAYIGLSSKSYGTLTIGRHTSMMLDAVPAFDALQGAQLFTPIGYSGAYGGGGATDSSRLDNSLKYKLNVEGFNAGVLYKFGGVAGSTSSRSALEAGLGYEIGGFAVQFIYQGIKDATSISNPDGVINLGVTAVPANGATPAVKAVNAEYEPLGTVTLTCENTTSRELLVRYKTEIWGIYAGYQKIAYDNPSNPVQDAGISSVYGYAVGQYDATAGAVSNTKLSTMPYATTVNPFITERDWTVTFISANVNATKKLNLALGFYNVEQNAYTAGSFKGTTSTYVAGSTNYSSFLADYTMVKNLDAYLGVMNVKALGGMATGYAFSSNTTLGLGLRYKF